MAADARKIILGNVVGAAVGAAATAGGAGGGAKVGGGAEVAAAASRDEAEARRIILGKGAATAPAAAASNSNVERGGGSDEDDAPPGSHTPPPLRPQQAAVAPRHKTVIVKYMRFNEVQLRVSYDGKPRSFHEVRLLLDSSTLTDFHGRWRDLINQLKGNAVWSVLKSIAGLQKRRMGWGHSNTPSGAAARVSIAAAAPHAQPLGHAPSAEDAAAAGTYSEEIFLPGGEEEFAAGAGAGGGLWAGVVAEAEKGKAKKKTKVVKNRIAGIAKKLFFGGSSSGGGGSGGGDDNGDSTDNKKTRADKARQEILASWGKPGRGGP